MTKTVMLLDCDGVIFPFSGNTGWHERPSKADIFTGDNRRFKEYYSPTLIRELRKIIKSNLVEVWWASAWNPEANKLEELFNFPHLKRAFASCSEGDMRPKINAALQVVRGGDRLIWVDDLVPQHGVLYDELIEADALLVQPNPNRGMQMPHIRQIQHYIGMEVPVS